ncbi:hypothetical protein LINPERPRIM_LOCUS66 [Linum perenne]
MPNGKGDWGSGALRNPTFPFSRN